METIQEYAEQAQTTLVNAESLCKRAELHLESVRAELTEQLPISLDQTSVAKEALIVQHQTLVRVLEDLDSRVKSLNHSLITDYSHKLEPSLVKLDNILDILEHTEVPMDLVNAASTSSHHPSCLADFITMEAISILKKNIAIYHTNSAKIADRLSADAGSLTQEFASFKKRYQRVIKTSEEIVLFQMDVSSTKKTSKTAQILEENAALEHELTSLLEMLTNHYDQCSQAVRDPNTSDADLEVLRNDAVELPDVLKEVAAVGEIIANNEGRSKKLTGEILKATETIFSSINELLRDYRDFKVKIVQFMYFCKAAERFLAESGLENAVNMPPYHQFHSVVSQLEYHYSHFYSIYTSKYLLELHREKYQYPRNFLERINRFLNEDLHQMHEQEINRRKQWVAQYGDFIPKEFTLPGEVHIPIVSQVVTECLDDVANEIKGGKLQVTPQERKLLEFIKRIGN
ncbi:autophagy-related protein 17 [Diutina catenulata]